MHISFSNLILEITENLDNVGKLRPDYFVSSNSPFSPHQTANFPSTNFSGLLPFGLGKFHGKY